MNIRCDNDVLFTRELIITDSWGNKLPVLPPYMRTAVYVLIDRASSMDAIKLVRGFTNCSLLQSKQLCDAMKEIGQDHPMWT